MTTSQNIILASSLSNQTLDATCPDSLKTSLAMNPADHSKVHDLIDRLLVFSRHHDLNWREQKCGRKEFRKIIELIFATPPENWKGADAELVMLFSALSLSGIGLEQVDKDVTYYFS